MQLKFEHVMKYWERIEGPMKPTKSSAFGERICWKISEATLTGPTINAHLAMPGTDWMRIGGDGIRRADLRVQLITEDNETILMTYDIAIIRASDAFLTALQSGKSTGFEDQYMRMSPRFETGKNNYSWLEQYIFIGTGRLVGEKEIEYEIFQLM